jgi:hypothetical protein
MDDLTEENNEIYTPLFEQVLNSSKVKELEIINESIE